MATVARCETAPKGHHHDPALRAEALRRVLVHWEPAVDVARDLRIPTGTLYAWVHEVRHQHSPGPGADLELAAERVQQLLDAAPLELQTRRDIQGAVVRLVVLAMQRP